MSKLFITLFVIFFFVNVVRADLFSDAWEDIQRDYFEVTAAIINGTEMIANATISWLDDFESPSLSEYIVSQSSVLLHYLHQITSVSLTGLVDRFSEEIFEIGKNLKAFFIVYDYSTYGKHLLASLLSGYAAIGLFGIIVVIVIIWGSRNYYLARDENGEVVHELDMLFEEKDTARLRDVSNQIDGLTEEFPDLLLEGQPETPESILHSELKRRLKEELDNYSDLDRVRLLGGREEFFSYVVTEEKFWSKIVLTIITLFGLAFLYSVYMTVDVIRAKELARQEHGTINNAFSWIVEKYERITEANIKLDKPNLWTWKLTMNFLVRAFMDYAESLDLVDKVDETVVVCMALTLSVLSLVIFIFLCEIRVSFTIFVKNTPLDTDLRPDVLRKMGIRYKDPMMSMVVEEYPLMYRLKRFFRCSSRVEYLISYELLAQLINPAAWNYGSDEQMCVEKMSHVASVICSINIDRHFYSSCNAFENTVRLAKYKYLTRMMARMESF